jgi:signal-transduction protein with cAMP-binding, CBS, and nucleotidyltransferase domain
VYSTRVKDLMTKDIVTVNLEEGIEKVAQLMVKNEIGSVLVKDDFKTIGIITKRDILEKVVIYCNNPCGAKAKDIATRKIITISSEKTIKDVLMLMYENKIKRILVKNTESDGISGIITTHDLIAAFSSLEVRSSPK